MKKNKHALYFLLLVFCLIKSQAQINLVPNGDFEDTKECVSGQAMFHIGQGWFKPQNVPISLTDPCQYGIYWAGTDTFGINKTRSSYFETYGFFINVQGLIHQRAYLSRQLDQPLVPGQRYYFEMSFRTVDTVPNLKWITTDFTDAQSVAFSTDKPSYDSNNQNDYLSMRPIATHPLVMDYKWHKLKTCFTATGNEKYIIIGNFKSNAETIRVPTGQVSKTNYTSCTQIVDNIIIAPVQVSLPDTAVCHGQSVTLNVANTLIDSLQYRWHDGTTTPQYIAKKTEHISVQVIYPVENCVARGDMNFKSLGDDYKPIAIDTTLCQNEKMTFMAGSGLAGEIITWQNGSKERHLTANTEGVYLAKVSNTCASWTDTFRLHINHCGFEAYIPNAFSPNGDGVNDVFKPYFKTDNIKIEHYNLHIYNRWGSSIFASQNINDAWDGSFRGQICDSGIYIWTLTVRILLNGKEQIKELSGDVAIIK